jgi:REP element-mobilizing transposase RayT
MRDFQFFDPKQDLAVVCKTLPHWAQSGTITFITWRTADSLPVAVLERITSERAKLIRAFGLDPATDWRHELAKRAAPERGRLQSALFESWDKHLDAGAGECLLARPELSRIVADSLHHFDQSRYILTDFVIMPNHVHLLAAFPDEDAMLSQCTSWKRFTARQINAIVGRGGAFWQVEQFDHLVRSAEQFEHYRRYIAENPGRARLALDPCCLYSKDLGR